MAQKSNIKKMRTKVRKCASEYRGQRTYRAAAADLKCSPSTYHRLENTGQASAEVLATLLFISGTDPREVLPCK